MKGGGILPVTFETQWLAQLQRLQDLLSHHHGIALVVLDGEGRELTVPSGLPGPCALQGSDPTHPCLRYIPAAIANVRLNRQPAEIKCPNGRPCFVSPVGVSLDECDEECLLFLLGSATNETRPEILDLVQLVFRLVHPTREGVMDEPARTAPVPRTRPATVAAGQRPMALQIKLTEREYEILALIGAGLSNRELAARLYISEATVKTHITHLLQKLGLVNRTEAALYALREGILPGNPPLSGSPKQLD